MERPTIELIGVVRELVNSTVRSVDPYLAMGLNRVMAQVDDRQIFNGIRGLFSRVFSPSRGAIEAEQKVETVEVEKAKEVEQNYLKIILNTRRGDSGEAPKEVQTVFKRLNAKKLMLSTQGLTTLPNDRTVFEVAGTDLSASVSWDVLGKDQNGYEIAQYRILLSSPSMSPTQISRWLNAESAKDTMGFERQMLVELSTNSYDFMTFKSKKTFSNTFVPNGDSIRKRIRRAVAEETPLGFFVHGIPGTGKTSFVQALLNELGPDFHGFLVTDKTGDWNKRITFQDYEFKYRKEFYNVSTDRRVVIYDECEQFSFFLNREEMSRKRKREEEEEAEKPPLYRKKDFEPTMTTCEFLEILAGVRPRQTWIVAMTNHPEMVDPALKRRGRFGDVVVDLSQGLPEDCKLNLFRHTAGRDPTPEEAAKLAEMKSGAEIEGFGEECA